MTRSRSLRCRSVASTFLLLILILLIPWGYILTLSEKSWAAYLPDEVSADSSGICVPVFPPRYRDRVIVLMYHQIGFQNQRRGVIPPELFEAHMLYLKKMGYHPISHEAFVNFLEGKGKVPENAILITFDDGYESFYRYAYPILKKYEFPAVIFVIVGEAQKRSHSGNSPHLSWDEIGEIERSGLVAIESHTYDSHYYALADPRRHKRPVLITRVYDPITGRRETREEYEARVRSDLWLAKHLLEQHLHAQVLSLAFPYGAYNPTVVNIARDVGYRYFYTVRGGVNMPGRDAIYVKRISAGDSYVTLPVLNRRISDAVSTGPFFMKPYISLVQPRITTPQREKTTSSY